MYFVLTVGRSLQERSYLNVDPDNGPTGGRLRAGSRLLDSFLPRFSRVSSITESHSAKKCNARDNPKSKGCFKKDKILLFVPFKSPRAPLEFLERPMRVE